MKGGEGSGAIIKMRRSDRKISGAEKPNGESGPIGIWCLLGSMLFLDRGLFALLCRCRSAKVSPSDESNSVVRSMKKKGSDSSAQGIDDELEVGLPPFALPTLDWRVCRLVSRGENNYRVGLFSESYYQEYGMPYSSYQSGNRMVSVSLSVTQRGRRWYGVDTRY
jgi:hypothetical protein